MAPVEVLTVGHSTLSYEEFLGMLRRANVTAVMDVRSAPHSRHVPHFSRNALRDELQLDGIDYWFVGGKLGGRPNDTKFYCDGVADYEKMSQSDDFRHGLLLVLEVAKNRRLALMCSEQDPLDCHRCLLIGRALSNQGVQVRHIVRGSTVLSQDDIEERLLTQERDQRPDLFRPRAERLADAYRRRAQKVAFADSAMIRSDQLAVEYDGKS
jgi:uncharacterized protein (DUF488 family)